MTGSMGTIDELGIYRIASTPPVVPVVTVGSVRSAIAAVTRTVITDANGRSSPTPTLRRDSARSWPPSQSSDS